MSSFSSILITGANRGLGLEFVRQYLSFPTTKYIFATTRSLDKAEQLQQLAKQSSGKVHVLQLDVKNYSQYDQVVKQVQSVVGDDGLDLLINNAGVAFRNNLDSVTPQEMIENFEVNTVTPLMFTKALLPLLRNAAKKRNTLVVNITSLMGSIEDNSSGAAYSYRASKTALNMVSKSLAVDLSKDNVDVIALHPGWVKTDMGGSNAKLEISESVGNMIKTISGVNKDVVGKMLNHDGKVLPN